MLREAGVNPSTWRREGFTKAWIPDLVRRGAEPLRKSYCGFSAVVKAQGLRLVNYVGLDT